MLSQEDKAHILSGFPEIKLSYENITHKKVYNSDIVMAIPEGRKCFAWFSHFNDAPSVPPASEQEDSDRVLPGEGAIDLTLYCNELAATGYNGYLSLELFREDLWSKDPLEVATLGLNKMRPFVEG